MKRLFIYAAVGSLLCAIINTLFGPKIITWWFKPPVSVPIDCTNALHWSMDLLIKYQLFGIAAGAVLGLILSFVLRPVKN